MLVCSVVLRPQLLAGATSIIEAANALDNLVLGVGSDVTIDAPGSAVDYLDAFTGQRMVETASATDAQDATAVGAPSASGDFLARTSGLNTTHTNAYTALIDGLVADGIWTKLDVLYVFATQDSTTAKLNLISTSFPAVANGSPTFTADRGFAGVADSATVYISTGFNPVTASSPKFVQDSAHISFWSIADTGANYNFPIGFNNSGATFICGVFPSTPPGSALYRINSANFGGGAVTGTAYGHYIGSRPSSILVNGYRNGASHVTDGIASVAMPSLPIFVLAQNNNGAAVGDARQIAMASIGSSLTATDATNFYNRLRTYMTAVGVP